MQNHRQISNDVFRGSSDVSDCRGKVLIVEDDPNLRFGLESLIEEWGYETFAAADGEEALKFAIHERMRFDAIITDYNLGRGMTGAQMVKEIERRAGRQFPALILTGETGKESLAKIRASGIDVAHKPISPNDLQRRLSELLCERLVATLMA